jgi:hypothetical protein
MNKRDRDNLRFLLNKYEQGDEVVQEWMETIDRDELEYALELLLVYRTNKEHFDNIINTYFE